MDDFENISRTEKVSTMAADASVVRELWEVLISWDISSRILIDILLNSLKSGLNK